MTPATLSDIARKDTSRLTGTIAKALAANSPFINVIGGGTFPSGVSDEIRTSVQMQAAPGDSLALPTFVCDTELCGTVGLQDLTDAVDFTARLESKRGFGPRVCVKKGYSAFKSSYLAAEDSMKKLVTQYINSDIRAQLYLRSASKFNATKGYDFNSLFTGGSETDVGVKFTPLNPTGPVSFKALHTIARYMKEALFAETFGDGQKGMFRFIGSSDIIESFRAETGVKEILIALTNGSYRLGEVAVSGYSFEESPAYRGISFAVDQRPLRASAISGSGVPTLVDPVVIVTNASKNTAYAKVNPSWLTAPYEIGFLLADNSFNRLVPERYVGEGSFKFAPQLHMGELDWHYIVDNDCNTFGDYGWHKYQITRAYQPVRPQHVVAIIYKRCIADLGLPDCDVTSASSYTGGDQFATVGVC
ncbi:MAG: hypothetical protein HOO67_06030 [Candidatus Peribacteraceae bacterium]|nr:hypothetical protein [Candidatus Peribacteraceae bacterium]